MPCTMNYKRACDPSANITTRYRALELFLKAAQSVLGIVKVSAPLWRVLSELYKLLCCSETQH